MNWKCTNCEYTNSDRVKECQMCNEPSLPNQDKKEEVSECCGAMKGIGEAAICVHCGKLFVTKKDSSWEEEIDLYFKIWLDKNDAGYLKTQLKQFISSLLKNKDKEIMEIILKKKQKWTRPMLDTVIGEKTAEIVGNIGEHICDEIINAINKSK